MKKAIILTAFLILALITVPKLFAEDVLITNNGVPLELPEGISVKVHDVPAVPHNVVGAKLDAPKLIGLKQISKDLFLGIEVGKNIMSDPFRKDSREWFEDDLGGFAYMKVTYYGCFLNCP